jgi:hypothetical protein
MFEGYVDTVPFGTFRKKLFSEIGFFDESLVRNQDNELNARIRSTGGKIYQTPLLSTQYFAPDSFQKLIRQTYRNSKWHLFTIRRSRNAMGIRHLLPALFVGVFCALGFLSFFSAVARLMLGLLLFVYLASATYFSWRTPESIPVKAKALLPLGFLAFHMSYGFGVVCGASFVLHPPSTQPIRH